MREMAERRRLEGDVEQLRVEIGALEALQGGHSDPPAGHQDREDLELFQPSSFKVRNVFYVDYRPKLILYCGSRL